MNLHLDEYLGCIEKQEQTQTKELIVVGNPAVDELCRMYEAWTGKCHEGRWIITEKSYDLLFKYFKKKCFTSKDIRDFSIVLKRYEPKMYFGESGIFLSALMNTSEETDFELITAHLRRDLSGVGYLLGGKNITVIGNGGNHIGQLMTGGKIVVLGSTGIYTGTASECGEIHVSGEIQTIGGDCKAKIYHKGVQVWPR